MAHCGGEDPISNELGFSPQRQRQNDKQGAKKLQLSSTSVLDHIDKGGFQKLLSGFFPLRGGGLPPNSAKGFWAG